MKNPWKLYFVDFQQFELQLKDFCKIPPFQTMDVLELLTTMGGHLLKVQNWEVIARDASFHPAAMAALCSISLRQLERHFATRYHKTPSKWTRELRLRLAQQRISQGWSNKAVVDELGFSDSAHLCREFRKMCGATPRYYAPVRASDTMTASGRDVANLQ